MTEKSIESTGLQMVRLSSEAWLDHSFFVQQSLEERPKEAIPPAQPVTHNEILGLMRTFPLLNPRLPRTESRSHRTASSISQDVNLVAE
jgi:hypothetical protein